MADGSADDVLGQTLNMDFSQPDFTHGAPNDSSSNDIFDAPTAVALDTVNHRLFVAEDANNRLLVFDLSASNTLASGALITNTATINDGVGAIFETAPFTTTVAAEVRKVYAPLILKGYGGGW